MDTILKKRDEILSQVKDGSTLDNESIEKLILMEDMIIKSIAIEKSFQLLFRHPNRKKRLSISEGIAKLEKSTISTSTNMIVLLDNFREDRNKLCHEFKFPQNDIEIYDKLCNEFYIIMKLHKCDAEYFNELDNIWKEHNDMLHDMYNVKNYVNELENNNIDQLNELANVNEELISCKKDIKIYINEIDSLKQQLKAKQVSRNKSYFRLYDGICGAIDAIKDSIFGRDSFYENSL